MGNNPPWQAQEDLLGAALRRGRSVLFAGGRGAGVTTLTRSLDTLLRNDGHFHVVTLTLQAEAVELQSREAFLTRLLDLPEGGDIPTVIAAHDLICNRLASEAKARYIVLVDGFHRLGRVSWGVDLADFLRALLGECPRFSVALFTKPSTDILTTGASPLSNVCSRFVAEPADSARVREWYRVEGVRAEVAMRAWRLTGGCPALIPDAVAALEVDTASAAACVAERRESWLDAHVRELTPSARDALFQLYEGPVSGGRLRNELGSVEAYRVDGELKANLLLAESGHGQLELSSEVHKVWLAGAVAARRNATRQRLTFRDIEAYRTLSELEWFLRDWLARRLSDASAQDWWETRIPDELRQRAEHRYELESKSFVEPSKFHEDYLDFSDFREILRFRENWNSLFRVVYAEWRERLEEALVQVEAIRRKVAHSRPVTDAEFASLISHAALVREILSR